MTQRFTSLLFSLLLILVATGALPALAASSTEPICVFLIQSDSGEAIINRCRSCREVTLQRSRAGESVPNVRDMQLPAENVTPAPFRGPGRTRILGERSCPKPADSRAALDTRIRQ